MAFVLLFPAMVKVPWHLCYYSLPWGRYHGICVIIPCHGEGTMRAYMCVDMCTDVCADTCADTRRACAAYRAESSRPVDRSEYRRVHGPPRQTCRRRCRYRAHRLAFLLDAVLLAPPPALPCRGEDMCVDMCADMSIDKRSDMGRRTLQSQCSVARI